jgi:hypothetical protein
LLAFSPWQDRQIVETHRKMARGCRRSSLAAMHCRMID